MKIYRALWILLGLFGTAVALESSLDADIYTISYRDLQDTKQQKKVYQKIDQSLRALGFLMITDMPINEALVQKAYLESRLFFGLPEVEKRRLNGVQCNYQRGYCPFRVERAKDHFLSDQKESFMLGLYPDKAHPNVWPKNKSFARVMQTFSHLLMARAKECLEVMALSAGEEKKVFSHHFDESTPSSMRLLHYPSFKVATREKIWAAEHTDISLISLIACPWMDGFDPKNCVQGLEVSDGQGGWLAVKIPRKSVLVRVGDLLQNISNGYFKSATFRIKATDVMEQVDRYSIVLYCHPKGDTDLTPLPCFIAKCGGRVCYPQATRDELLAERLVDINLAGSDRLIGSLAQSGLIERMKTFKMASPRVVKKVKDYESKHKMEKQTPG